MRTAFPIPRPTLAPDGKTFEVLGWRVFSPGYWKGDFYSPARVARIVANYRTLKAANPNYAPRARLGHDAKQRLALSLGLPNVGRVTDLRPTPDGGFEIDVRGIPRFGLVTNEQGETQQFDLQEAFDHGQYDSGSVEFVRTQRNPLRPTETLTDVFDGIAFLGEEHPAVKDTARPVTSTPDAQFSDRYRLCFSDFTPETNMRDQWIQAICDATGMTPDDPTLAGMTDEQLQAWAEKMGSQQFSDFCRTKYAAPVPVPAPQADPNAPSLADVNKRLMAAEAALTDQKKQADDVTTQTLMSEAVRVVDDCVKTGRLMPRLKPQTLADLKKLATDRTVFSDGADKGLTPLQAELKALQNRVPDAMFSEVVDDSPKGVSGSAGVSEFARKALSHDPKGMAIRRNLDAAK